jgi:hypothetical protein
MKRREAEKAVIEAAKEATHFWRMERTGSSLMAQNIRATVDTLNACAAPDLDALNAAVAEAYEAWVTRNAPGGTESVVLHEAVVARREALKPRPRYAPIPVTGVVILDNNTGNALNTLEVAALLNAKEAKP